MENNGDCVDDQGSGWFQVKKRHRTSSKFSIPSLTWGFSNKTYGFVRNQTSSNEKALNSHRRLPSLAPKGERVPANHMKADGQGISTSSKDAHGRAPSSRVQLDGEGTSTSSKDAGQDMHCLEKHVINQETEIPKPPFCSPTKTPGLDGGTSTAEGIPKTGNFVKIKWGDLEDDVLVPHGCHGNSNGVSEVKCNGIEDNHVADGNLLMADDLVSHVSPCSAPQEGKECLAPEDAEQFPDAMCNSAVWIESVEGKCKMSCEISSENLGPSDVKGIAVTLNDAVGSPGETHTEPRCMEAGISPHPDNPAVENCSLSAIEGGGIIMEGEGHGLSDKSENGVLDISETTATDQVSDTGRDLEHSVPLHHQNGDPEASGEALVTSAMGDWRELQDSGVGENELGESKERFRQRLWCFLFENLNRAVDELYLLCELECDVEQMNEAILVLGEAASDFRELKSRVEGFEYVKRSPSQPSKDGSPANLKTDHRRPHALSWEVRRMASSPHRAEILSSSLEAFRKIQQERASKHKAHEAQGPGTACQTQHVSADLPQKSPIRNDAVPNTRELGIKTRKLNGISDLTHGNASGERKTVETSRLSKVVVQNSRLLPQSSSPSDSNISQVSMKSGPSAAGKGKKELLGSVSELEKQMTKKEKVLTETKVEKFPKSADSLRGHGPVVEKDKEKEKRNTTSFKSMDAWKEKRNWEDILAAPLRSSSRVSHSPGLSRKSMERARVLHDKLMSPEKKKKTALDMRREVEEKHARAMRIRSEIENERVQRLQRTSEKLNRVNEWQAVRSLKLREGMVARHQRSESRHEAYLAQVVRRAGDESSKVNEVRFITSLNEENKKLMLRQKLQGSELRRAEKLQVIRTKQKEDTAREEAVLERRKLLEAEKLQRLAETQRKKEEAQVRREEERRASSAAREAKAVEQLRRKEIRAKAQQEEAELLAQKLAERLSESEQRRKFYLEQIRERASMDFRDQSSPLFRRSSNKEGQGRSVSTNSVEDYQTTCMPGAGGSALGIGNGALQHSLKRRIKKIRQRLMALKYEFTEPPVGAESAGMGYRAQVGAARVKIGRWLQDLQRLRQARKEGAASIGLIIGDMIKFLEGKDSELHASRQAGLLDFIASALPASHTSKPEAYQVTIHLLRLLRVVLYIPANRSYFLAQNLLPPLIPMLSAALENYIKIAASLNAPGNTNSVSVKTSAENLESISEVMEGFLWTVTTILGHICSDERQLQMRDGLMELIVAYQVIHRLRDLFALYDRPQVEGSPFPSSILLSLNLLAVLTSRSRSLSSIDWDSYLAKVTSANKIEEAKLREGSVFGVVRDASVVNDAVGDQKLPQAPHLMVGLPLLDEEKLSPNSVALPLCDVPEDRPLDESCRLSVHEEPSPRAQDPGRECTDTAVELGSVGATSCKFTKDISGESSGSVIEELANTSLSQKDVRNISYTITEQNAQNVDITADLKNGNGQGISLSQPVAFFISAIAETGLVCLPSLLTAVLLQANNRLSSEQGSYVLPSNFEEVATGVLKVLNNLALLDITVLQSMLARPDLKMEFFHLMSFLLSHCTSKWKVASDQVGLLLLESLLLLGYFALFHPGNQAVLRWGKSPTILHKVCDLPFAFFSDPELTPILAGTLIASCYECEQNRGVVQQELSMEMLLSLIKSCGQAIQSDSSPPDNVMTDDPCDQSIPEPRKLQADLSRSSRGNLRSARNLSGKGAVVGSNPRVGKVKNQRDAKGTKTCDDWAFKHNLPALEISSSFMLHSRFPSSFIDRAEEFFSAGSQL